METFSVGQIVRIKSDESRKGVVLTYDGTLEKAQVFIDNSVQSFYASQLIPFDEADDKPTSYSSREVLHAFLSSLQIREPDNSSLFSLNSGKIDFIPYQYRPVLKFIKSDEPRILIADSVGVGKTIEAELILKELQARNEIESVLIICPKPLVTERKWENELKKFGEDFVALDSGNLNYCIEETDVSGEWPFRFKKCIIPYSLFDKELLYGKSNMKKGLLDLDPPPHFDLIIVDEAHHIRNTDTSRYGIVNYFTQNSDAAVFLTATPVELKSHDLFVLLNSLRPDIFIDTSTFEAMVEPNEFINEATSVIRKKQDSWNLYAMDSLEKAENTEWGKATFAHDPEFKEVIELLKKAMISDNERVKLITEIEQFNTFSHVINRTRRRDIGQFTVRKSETVRCVFTDEQKEFYLHLLETERNIMQILHGENVALMMSMLERQAASCIHGMAHLLDAILHRNIIALTEEFGEVDENLMKNIIEKLQDQFSELKNLADNLPSEDLKYENLLSVIKEKQQLENNKIIIFSTFRHTLNYLLMRLEEDDLRVAVIHGDVPDSERRELRNRFTLEKENENAIDIMLFSEVGCEGLDYQFCNYMVNYDLPWNPMKIEQRIGRIDRNGQKSESVVIVNMITEETVDQKIYDRCLLRIGVFENSIGDCESILGEVTQQIQSVATSFELTEKEREEKLQQIADNQIRFVQEKERLEEEQYNLLGIQINQEEMQDEINNATNCWLQPDELKILLNKYFKSIGYRELSVSEETVYHLRISREVKQKLLQDYSKLRLRKNKINYLWEKWLKTENQYLSISFYPSDVVNNSIDDTLLLNISHPLILQAAHSNEIENVHYVYINKHDDSLSVGENRFIIYQWKYFGSYTDKKLIVIADNQDIQDEINKNIALYADYSEHEMYDSNHWEKLDVMHKFMWQTEKQKYIEKNNKIVAYKKQSLVTSYNARKRLAEGQIAQTSDEKIIKMRTAQLLRAQNIFQRKMQELDDCIDKVDITFKPIVYGILNISRS